jgi:hypothetical protein
MLGEDTTAILADVLGYTAGEIAELLHLGVVRQFSAPQAA